MAFISFCDEFVMKPFNEIRHILRKNETCLAQCQTSILIENVFVAVVMAMHWTHNKTVMNILYVFYRFFHFSEQ